MSEFTTDQKVYITARQTGKTAFFTDLQESEFYKKYVESYLSNIEQFTKEELAKIVKQIIESGAMRRLKFTLLIKNR